jgi:hypothetical protein
MRPWCRSFKHKVHELFQYILGHLLRVRLSPEFASRLLDLHIESSCSMTETLRMTGTLDGTQSNYPLLLERLRAHAITCFNEAPFTQNVLFFSLPLLARASLKRVAPWRVTSPGLPTPATTVLWRRQPASCLAPCHPL